MRHDATSSAHPNDDLLLALNDGVLFAGDRPTVETHLQSCAKCRTRLLALTDDLAPAPMAPVTPPAPRPTAAPVAPAPRPRPYALRGAMLARLTAVVALMGILISLGVVAGRELSRQSRDPIELPAAPAAPPLLAPSLARPVAPEEPSAGASDAEAAPTSPGAAAPAAATPAPPAAPRIVASPPFTGLVITSPNPDFRWRVNGTTVERTSNGGAAWSAQTVALPAAIEAGSSPSAAVCWLVGKSGTVLVAVGSEWRTLSMGDALNLVAVKATDSAKATVTASDGRRFATTDAGASWSELQ